MAGLVDADPEVAQRGRHKAVDVDPARAEVGLGVLGHELGDQVGPGRKLRRREAVARV